MSTLATISRLLNRIRADVAISSRATEYDELLGASRNLGYRLVSMTEFDRLRRSGDLEADGRYLAIRHDVDIADLRGNEAFHRIEVRHGAHATYYFRLRTAPPHARFIRRLREDGFEVGYHFEEAATIAKRLGLRDRAEVLARGNEIAAAFRANLLTFRSQWNPDIVSVASHGDWINRRLGVVNHEFVGPDLLAELDLAFEAYQPDLHAAFDVYVSDVATPPSRWRLEYGLADALREGRPKIYLLTHERQWHASPIVKTRENVDRLIDEGVYRVRLARPPGRSAK